MNEVSGRVALVIACNFSLFTHYQIIILYVLFELFLHLVLHALVVIDLI